MVVATCALLAGSAMGCVSEDAAPGEGDESGLAFEFGPGAHVLTLSTFWTPQAVVKVTSNEGTPPRSCTGSNCQFAYLSGAGLTLRIPFPNDKPNCMHFDHWQGACSGTASTCTVTLDSDKSVTAVWVDTIGCDPG